MKQVRYLFAVGVFTKSKHPKKWQIVGRKDGDTGFVKKESLSKAYKKHYRAKKRGKVIR